MQKHIAATLVLFLSACSLVPASPTITTSPLDTSTPATRATATNTPTPTIPPASVPAGLLPAPLYSLSDISGTVQVWRVNLDGSQTQITNEAEGVTSMDVSPVDGTLAYVSGKRLVLIDKNGFLPRVLVDGFDVKRPVWSPDGTKLAYALDGVKVFNLETGEWYTVVSNINSGDRNMRLYTPLQWSPDGKKIVVETGFYECSDFKLFTTGGIELATFGFGSIGSSLWSADSQTLYFASPVSGGACATPGGLWKINAQSGEITTVSTTTTIGGIFFAGWPVLAPDGMLQFFFADTPATGAFSDVWVNDLRLVRSPLKTRLQLEVLPQPATFFFDWNNMDEVLWSPDASFALLTHQTVPYSQTRLMKIIDEAPLELGNIGWSLHWGLADAVPVTPQAPLPSSNLVTNTDNQYRIVFNAMDQSFGALLKIINADGSGLVTIYPWWEGDPWVQQPVWSSNGSQLAFVAAGMVYQVDLQTGSYGPFTGLPLPGEGGPDKYYDIAWSPGGGRYLAVHYTTDEDIGPFRADRNLGIYDMDSRDWVTFPILQVRDPGEIRGTAAIPNNQQMAFSPFIPLTGAGESYDATLRPVWSPDGTRLAFLGQDPESGESGIYIGFIDGIARLVNNSLTMPSALAWSPDGQFLYGVSFFEDAYQVFSIQINTRQVSQLTTGPDWVYPYISVSPDGKLIVFSRGDASPYIFALNLDGSNSVNLTPANPQSSYPAWSPDGKYILFRSFTGNDIDGLNMMNADGTDIHKIYTYTSSGSSFPSWSPVPVTP